MKNCLYCNTAIQDAALICKNCKRPISETSVKTKLTVKQYAFYGLLGIIALYLWYLAIPVVSIWYLWKKTSFGTTEKVVGTAMIFAVIFPIIGLVVSINVDAPKIIVESPINGAKIGAATTTIVGVLHQKGATLAINGSPVSVQEDGRFSHEVKLIRPEMQFLLRANEGDYEETQTLRISREPTPEEAVAIQKAKVAAEAKAKAELVAWEKSKAGKLCKTHPEWGKEICKKVADGYHWIGMSYEMLIASYGSKPDSANPSNYGGATQWQWCWRDYEPSCFYDQNGDGIVDAYN